MHNLRFFSIQLFTILLLFIACTSTTEREVISIGKTVKIQYSPDIKSKAKLTFQWSYQNIPTNSTPKLLIDNNKALFTPDIVGDYDILLSVRSESNDEIASEFYYFSVIKDTVSRSIKKQTQTADIIDNSEPKPTKPFKSKKVIPPKVKKKVIPKPSSPKLDIPAVAGKYTIQVASWPSLEEARNDQLSLIDAGYDSYLQRVFITEKDEVWWRVRVGAFSDYSIAIAVHKQLIQLRGKDIWIDYVRQEQNK
ncbi:MAG: SPOR domain-containing protein [Candidatus Marinimicrobia bacterium]|nr:SPOR domain-containing protein [Candidatus Neomarinimicrobiota bacterium]MBL7023438.1 SPOR domain-containing protein [Candidatus Neomarinimicrobiota bacterium]MBL7108813.1 SPOR domain-containing protein [Candidatus Neomarinimicrobiota bacterium]